jgi:leader peptidase (prepilin peptidase)/N-methyltransferase
MLASIQGSVVGVVLILLGKGQPGPDPARPPAEGEWVPPRHGVPFGPFLVLGAVEWLLLSAPLAELVPALEVFR